MASAAPAKPANGNRQRTLVFSIGAGSGLAVAAAVLQLIRPNAGQVLAVMAAWGPMFLVVMLGMILFYLMLGGWGQRLVDAMTTNAVAQQQMADAMQQIAHRDDVRDRERELALDHLAYTTQTILRTVQGIEERQLALTERQLAKGAGS
jgi:SNF family Na+-dependent transporter